TQLFASAGVDAQSLFPRREGNLAATTEATFTPGSTAVGFRIDGNEWSDPTKNTQEQPGGGYGHHLRFFKLKNAKGQFVPDTYLLVMDFQGINYDYNDNTYVISNIRPESGAGAVQMASIPTSRQFSATRIASADELLAPSEDSLV
ncbi:MAG: hypothetical protein QOE14_523, partial [Humisphaera sp.]|nr:hypothetical protein [Humisphaera sp.]